MCFIYVHDSRDPDSSIIDEEEPDDSRHISRWLKFNDTIVEEFAMTDSALEAECFGGSIKTSSSDPRELPVALGTGRYRTLRSFPSTLGLLSLP